ncbi:hypothetical protein D3C80_1556890 [compost metagenome]
MEADLLEAVDSDHAQVESLLGAVVCVFVLFDTAQEFVVVLADVIRALSNLTNILHRVIDFS